MSTTPRFVPKAAVVLALVSVPFITLHRLYAGEGCPETSPLTVTCPDTVPSCPSSGPCSPDFDTKGSVLEDGNWDCQDNSGTLSQCVTARVPPGTTFGTALCYTTYPCTSDGAGGCIVQTSAQGQEYTKVIKLGEQCARDPGR